MHTAHCEHIAWVDLNFRLPRGMVMVISSALVRSHQSTYEGSFGPVSPTLVWIVGYGWWLVVGFNDSAYTVPYLGYVHGPPSVRMRAVHLSLTCMRSNWDRDVLVPGVREGCECRARFSDWEMCRCAPMHIGLPA